jgi:hypothetical protein
MGYQSEVHSRDRFFNAIFIWTYHDGCSLELITTYLPSTAAVAMAFFVVVVRDKLVHQFCPLFRKLEDIGR